MRKLLAIVLMLCCALMTGCKSTSADRIVTDNVKYYTESVTNVNGRSVVLVFMKKMMFYTIKHLFHRRKRSLIM